MFDYSKLKGLIIECYGSQKCFAEAMEISESYLSGLLHNKIDWSQSLVVSAMKLLDISRKDIGTYFFAPVV